MAITNYTFFNWNQTYSYAKWDVIYGAISSDTMYYYSTTDNNTSANPLSLYNFSPVIASRTDNVMRMYFNQTGTTYFQPGSIAIISGIQPDSSSNYTGTVLAAGPGYIDYLNPGLNTSISCTAGGVTAPIHPYWTTGFYWIPSWTTEALHDFLIVNTKLGDSYSQRQSFALNSNVMSWNLMYIDRTDKETSSLLNFLQNQGGATPFIINFPIGRLYNRAGLKYITTPQQQARHQLTSYGLNAITVPITQVFDLG